MPLPPWDNVTTAANVMIVACIDHYNDSFLTGCECDICKAVENLSKIMGDKSFDLYFRYAQDKIREHEENGISAR